VTAPTLDRPAVAALLFDPSIESDGLTIDTAHGPVDLVAVQRYLNGERLHLTRAEHSYIKALVAARLAVYPSSRKAA
jgi:hypothetical protein